MRFYNFKSVALVRMGQGAAVITGIKETSLAYLDEAGRSWAIDLAECAHIYQCLSSAGAFPPGDEMDWGVLAGTMPGPATLEARGGVVGLRAAIDDPPWFQFLDRRRTQFEFRDYEHIHTALLRPLAAAGPWQTWDAS